MSRVLPILFNTDMVRAILDGRKTVTRRVIKPQPKCYLAYTYASSCHKDIGTWGYPSKDSEKYWGGKYRLPKDLAEEDVRRRWTPPCRAEDILYVRETFCYHEYAREPWYGYKADGDYRDMDMRWTPSIHMPKEAARIFLKVKNVRVERLQDITEEQAKAEGICEEWAMAWWKPTYYDPDSGGYPKYRDTFAFDLWNSTIKKSELDKYGWKANPYVWVIEFERCEKPENF